MNIWRPLLFVSVIGTALVIAGCADEHQQSNEQDQPAAAKPAVTKLAVPVIDASHMQPRVASRIREAQQAIERDPESAAAWGRLGNVCHVHRELEPAMICYREAHRLAPDDFRWAYFLARVLELEGQANDEVLVLYGQAIDLNPSYAPAHSRLGDALVREGRLEAGASALQQAVALDPQLSKAHRSLGQVLLISGDVDRALIHLEKASALQPQDAAVWASLAQGYARKGDSDRAEEAATKAQARKSIHALVDPAMQEVSDEGISSTICARRAREYMNRGDFLNALQQFLIVAEVDSENAQLHQQIASVAQRAGRPGQAVKHLDRAIALAPDDVGPRSRLASVLLQAGRTPEAVVHLQRAVTEIPENSELHALLGAALAQSGQVAEAIAAFERADKLGDLSSRAFNNWGNSLRASGAVEEAVPKYEAALRLDPDYANAHYNFGAALEQLERMEAAIEHYQAAVKLDPNHPAKDSLDRLSSESP